MKYGIAPISNVPQKTLDYLLKDVFKHDFGDTIQIIVNGELYPIELKNDTIVLKEE